MKFSAETAGYVTGVLMFIAFGAGFALGGLREVTKIATLDVRHVTPAVVAENEVIKLPGYGTRNLEYGFVNHQGRNTRQEAEEFLRELNAKRVYVKQTSPEAELVELFYRRVE